MTALKAAHTPGPWTFRDQHNGDQPQAEFPTRVQFGRGGYDTGAIVGCVYVWQHDTESAKANAARIVACVNACEGMADPAVEISGLRSRSDNVPAMCAEVTALRAEVERLREALQALLESIGSEGSAPSVAYAVHHYSRPAQKEPFFRARKQARAALGGGK